MNAKLQEKTYPHRFVSLLKSIKAQAIIASDRLKEIESPIVKKLNPDDNTILMCDSGWLRRKFSRSCNDCLTKVHSKFQLLQNAIRDTQQLVNECVEKYETQAFGGKRKEIRTEIEKVMRYNPGPTLTDFTEIHSFERNIVEPLDLYLPKTNDNAVIALKMCVSAHYDNYMRIRLEHHNQIQQLAK